ncbi:hypothetical protein KL911_001098 [Ogataea haglerorum]|uniref:uncharacterized protein n=1 Tax=Ogataea haglerorum TaxID=1937702 RepID=UPI001C8A73E8|nr:uncharacterized protein KL911_001098 [Ogataea haglerorum]KAG7758122.1 hypothetical protein KL911_001098 [Ogataea haglerorum]
MFWRKRAQDSSVPEQVEPTEPSGGSGQDGLADLQKALADAYVSKSAESTSQATERSLNSMREKASKRAESISLDKFPVSEWLPESNMLERNVLQSTASSKARPRESKKHGSKRYNKTNKPVLMDDFPFDRTLGRGRKGIDISHLVEFQLPEHNVVTGHGRRPSSRKHRAQSARLNLTGRQNVNVNYRFIVDYRGDYRTQILDPNVPLDDASILRVLINKNDHQCPICLGDEFIAPRMTRCGHVFCYTCLLRLFAAFSTQEDYRGRVKCPLCSEDIREKHELLPVLITKVDERFERPSVDQPVDLELMYRPASRVFAQPFRLYLENCQFDGDIPWIPNFATVDNFLNDSRYVKYSRIMQCGPDFALKCFQQELETLKLHRALDSELYGDSTHHYELAELKIRSHMDAMAASFAESSQAAIPDSPDSLSLCLDELSLRQQQFQETEKGFFFYQTAFNSSVKYFLTNLDVQILKSLYGDYSAFPLTLHPILENINYEYSPLTEETIGKLKYLGHLPVGTEIGFLELDWTDQLPQFPKEISARFSKKLSERSRASRNKKRREDHSKAVFEKELELKTLQFYSKENNLSLTDYGYGEQASPHKFVESDAPPLGENVLLPEDESKYKTTVWGTRILKSEEPDSDQYDAEAELIIQQAKEAANATGKKKKKIVLSFT